MTFDEIFQAVQSKFPKGVLGREEVKPDNFIKIDPGSIHDIVKFFRDELNFETIGCLSGVDYPAQSTLAVVYHLQSYHHKMVVPLKATLPRQDGVSVRTISDLYKGANWLERETYDLVGIKFDGHPDMKRMFLPQDWTGHPLRKDYKTPDYYNGMPVPLYFEENA